MWRDSVVFKAIPGPRFSSVLLLWNSLPFSWTYKLLPSIRSLARPTRLVTTENTSIERCGILETDVSFQTTLLPCIWSISLSPIKFKFTRFDFFFFVFSLLSFSFFFPFSFHLPFSLFFPFTSFSALLLPSSKTF